MKINHEGEMITARSPLRCLPRIEYYIVFPLESDVVGEAVLLYEVTVGVI